MAPTRKLCKKIIRQFCEDSSPHRLHEEGCVVCGRLVRSEVMHSPDELDDDSFDILIPSSSGVTRALRRSTNDPISDIPGPVLASNCSKVCDKCFGSLVKGKVPTLSLANGLWLGDVPAELQGLNFVEKLLVARVRHNRCIVRVSSSGMHKMIANAICFKHPSQKIYKALPPPLEELDDVLALVFTGPCAPTEEDFKRTPLLVRRKKVMRALECLKLNHKDYGDLEIDYDELQRYPEAGPPVSVEYRYADSNKRPEATSVHDMEDNDGNDSGPCPFTVHGITGDDYDRLPLKLPLTMSKSKTAQLQDLF
ncbi:hypothetical protein BJ138DRAFT_1138088 [Hygrophoropsis aurantiaca]|uniref:Uncharacterized protein n=1 Tax=Hygrophoropsis aurantiaca TaxID=72124 RepID=A0ACB7ZZH6_9AGAM|nr:hypothetical protein BJ138DRAFT_1138088 [Hygrophoropsis aurantiaca]